MGFEQHIDRLGTYLPLSQVAFELVWDLKKSEYRRRTIRCQEEVGITLFRLVMGFEQNVKVEKERVGPPPPKNK